MFFVVKIQDSFLNSRSLMGYLATHNLGFDWIVLSALDHFVDLKIYILRSVIISCFSKERSTRREHSGIMPACQWHVRLMPIFWSVRSLPSSRETVQWAKLTWSQLTWTTAFCHMGSSLSPLATTTHLG